MIAVNGREPGAIADDAHVPMLVGLLLGQVRDVFVTEDWGGLRMSHIRLLSLLPADGASVSELAGLLGMTKQACGEFVRFLVGTGHLVSEVGVDDRRVRRVRRTALGDLTLARGNARIRRIERAWARRVGAERYEQFREVLAELVARS